MQASKRLLRSASQIEAESRIFHSAELAPTAEEAPTGNELLPPLLRACAKSLATPSLLNLRSSSTAASYELDETIDAWKAPGCLSSLILPRLPAKQDCIAWVVGGDSPTILIRVFNGVCMKCWQKQRCLMILSFG